MQGQYHFALSALAGIATAAVFPDVAQYPILSPALVCIGSVVGGLIPDIDSPTSAIGKALKPVSKSIRKGFGHRTITHSGLWLVPLCLIYFSCQSEYILGYIVGFFSHLLSDTLTKGGVPWLYPIKKKRYRLSCIRSGDGDGILAVLSLAMILSLNFVVRYFIDNIFL